MIISETSLTDMTSFEQMLKARLFSYCTHTLCYFSVGLGYLVNILRKQVFLTKQ